MFRTSIIAGCMTIVSMADPGVGSESRSDPEPKEEYLELDAPEPHHGHEPEPHHDHELEPHQDHEPEPIHEPEVEYHVPEPEPYYAPDPHHLEEANPYGHPWKAPSKKKRTRKCRIKRRGGGSCFRYAKSEGHDDGYEPAKI